jgi:hypothetical protein
MLYLGQSQFGLPRLAEGRSVLLAFGLLWMALCLFVCPALAISSATPSVRLEEPGEGFISVGFRPGTPLFVLLQTPVSTALNNPGDPLDAVVFQDMYLNNQLILHRNTRVKGVISILEKPIPGRNAILGFKFMELELPNGEILPFSAKVKTERPDYTWGGELTSGTKPLVVRHDISGIGSYNKVVFGGPRALGTHILFSPGERLTLILETPIKIVLPKPEVPAEEFEQ